MKSKGFTLLEVMIALAILSTALVILFSQQTISLDRKNEGRIIAKASLLAQELMSRLISQDPLLFGEEEGEIKGSTPPFRWRTKVEEADDIEGLMRLTVVVMWKEGEKTYDVTYVTYVASEF